MIHITGIYLIRNTINDKIYVGSSKNIRRRIQEHLSKLKLNKHPNKHLQNHFNKYKESLYFEIIQECEQKDLLKVEQYWITTLSPKFNNSLIAISNSKKGRTNEFKEKMRLLNIGKKLSEEHKRKIGDSSKGKILSKKTIEKIRKSREKKVIQFDKNRKIIAEFTSIKEAAKITGVDNTGISAVCNDRQGFAGGYIWKFKKY